MLALPVIAFVGLHHQGRSPILVPTPQHQTPVCLAMLTKDAAAQAALVAGTLAAAQPVPPLQLVSGGWCQRNCSCASQLWLESLQQQSGF